MVLVRWLDPQHPGSTVEDHLCRPCHDGLDIVVQNYMNNPGLTPIPAPSTVDTPNHVPEEWTQS